MNNVNPIFAGYLRAVSKQVPRGDWYVIEDMKKALTRHLNAALIECAALSRDLTGVAVDPDQLMVDLRNEFDPDISTSRIQDNFSDAFYASQGALKNIGAEPITARKSLPSGSAGE